MLKLYRLKVCLTPSEAHSAYCELYPAVPLTSIRRAVSDLTERGLLRKSATMRLGIYGKSEHCWELNDFTPVPAHESDEVVNAIGTRSVISNAINPPAPANTFAGDGNDRPPTANPPAEGPSPAIDFSSAHAPAEPVIATSDQTGEAREGAPRSQCPRPSQDQAWDSRGGRDTFTGELFAMPKPANMGTY